MKHRVILRAASMLCLCALLLSALPASLILSAFAQKHSLTYTAEIQYPAPKADTALCGTGTAAMQVLETDVIGMQVVLSADAEAIYTKVPSYSNDTGSATLALFAFDTDYDTTLLSDPIAEHTFVDFQDSAALTFRFPTSDPLPAGEYILLLYNMYDRTPGSGNGTGIGMWTYAAFEGQRAYYNGTYVSDSSYSVCVDYTTAPAKPYGIPTKPLASGDIDYAPHMEAVIDFRDSTSMALVGGGHQTKAAQKTEDGETFLRLSADTHANDPYQNISLPDTLIKCSEYKYLLIKLRRSEGSVLQSQVFFTTDETGISEAASVRPTYADTTDWQYVVVNLGVSGLYSGLLKTLRLDYYQNCEGTQWLDLQYIALFQSEEAARAFHDNFEDFQSTDIPGISGSDTQETTPDYSTYISADTPGESVAGTLTENGQLSYLYKTFTHEMDFSKSPDDYMMENGYGFSSIESAIVRDGVLQCKAFSTYAFYTKEILGDNYGIRGGELSLDLVLTDGTVAFTVRQIKPNDDFVYSGLRFALNADGMLSVADRDGFADTVQLDVDLSVPHGVAVIDTGDTIAFFIDGNAVYTLLYDGLAQTIQTPDGELHTSIHLPGAGYAAFRATRTRGHVDNVRYTHTDIVSKTVSATRPMDYSTWIATDDLDRTTPLHTEVGDANGKQVGIFYFLIHSDDMGGRYVNDVTRFYLDGGVENVSNRLSSMIGTNGAYWAEPYFGYYSSHDPWVYRKHAYMLSAAGVDFIFLDVSNNVFYVDRATVLFDTWKAIRDEGGTTPQIAFMYGDMPFTLLNGLYTLLEPFYENPAYRDLMYCVDGKPLLLGNNDTPDQRIWTVSGTTPQTKAEYLAKLRADEALMDFYRNDYQNVLSNYTVRKCWAWQAGIHKGYWDWLQESPQALGTDFDGKPEQISVSMGVHAHTSRGRSYQNGDNTYNPNGKFGFTLGTAQYGYFFAEQFEYALTQDVSTILITGWNEWYAGIHRAGSADQTCGQTPTPNYYMIDQMSPEYSRDGEPMKLRDGEGFGDNYYYQMVSYIRRFKGLSGASATVNGGDMRGEMSDGWDQVSPAFTDVVGDTDLRSELSFGAEFRYVNGSARNDLDTAKVSQDATHIHFYISTATPLITVDDSYWMNLYIDADRDPSTGWEGFDYMLNRSRTDKTVSVERFTDGRWEFTTVGEAEYTLGESFLVISVEKSLLGHSGTEAMACYFKWADHARVEGDVMRFMTEGDTAPNDRFMFSYTPSSLSDERGEGDTDDSETETDSAVDSDEQDTGAATVGETEDESDKGCSSHARMATPLLMISVALVVLKPDHSLLRRRKDH